ncbi:MAG: aldo/keto reductase [Hyphomicrobiales bacterium]|uniref:aldo/keto reductase n=1 Tax=Nisaea sp. TaxID=2024842 RepID=UPI00327E414F
MTDKQSEQWRVENRHLGRWQVSPIGFGAMPISWAAMVDHRDRAIATVHAALDTGVTLLDSSNIYAPSWDQTGYGERLLAESLRTWDAPPSQKEKVLVATKGGIIVTAEGGRRDASQGHLRDACTASLKALNVDQIDLYYLHWPAPEPSFEQQVENMMLLQQEGLIKSVGVSNISSDQLQVALDVGGTIAQGGIVAVQNEFSPRYRAHEDMISLTANAGIAYVPWSPFGGAGRAHQMGSQYAVFADVASRHNVSAYQIALAWLLHKSSNIIPIPGATRPETIRDSLGAMSVRLSKNDFELLSATIPEGTSQYPNTKPAPPLRKC